MPSIHPSVTPTDRDYRIMFALFLLGIIGASFLALWDPLHTAYETDVDIKKVMPDDYFQAPTNTASTLVELNGVWIDDLGRVRVAP